MRSGYDDGKYRVTADGLVIRNITQNDKGSFNNYVDKKRGVSGMSTVGHVTKGKQYLCKRFIFVHLMGLGIKIV